MQNTLNKNSALFSFFAFATVIFFLLPEISYSQSKGYPMLVPKERIRHESENKTKVFFPDEYSDLDENKARDAQLKSKEINDAIEQARQKYFQALILVQKRDTNRAVRYFDDALNKLNKLLSLSNIEDNADFSELAQSIISDYEEFVQNSNLINENSPAFMITEFLNKEIENVTTIYIPEEQAKPKSITQNYGKLPKPPDSLKIPLTENSAVQKSIEFLTRGTGKKIFKLWLERSAKWFPMMLEIAKDEDLPQEIIYLSMIESGMNPNAVSSAKAVGLWQFMRATGEMYDLNGKSSIFIDERRDPEKATRAAMRHLRDLYNEFGDWHLAMAAYNCGAGCVSRAIKRTNSDTLDYWKVREKLPGETRAYVPKFISAAKLALDPESYGFKIDSLKFHEKYEYDLYSLNEPVNLDAIAKAANTTVDEIKDLNPELLFNCTPPDRLPYKIKIPKNSLNLFSTNYANLAPEEKEPFLTHIVKNKESIASIAKRYSIRANDLARINNVASTKSRLKKGQELRIPVTISEPEIATETPTETTKPANQRLVNTERFSKHKVLNGETLFNIANMYGMDVARLRKINDLNYGDKILAGQSLYVEGEFQTKSNDMVREVPTEKLKKDAVIYHKVKKGETLAQIADDYNVKINDLRKWNKIKNSKVLKGQKLKILSNNNMENIAESTKSKRQSTTSSPIIHKVKSGETLGTISAKYGVTENQIKSWNEDVISGSTIFAGTRLKINDDGASQGSASAQKKNVNSTPKYYKVRRGDTLSEIAKKFGVSAKTLKKKNKNLNEKRLQAGVNIRIQ